MRTQDQLARIDKMLLDSDPTDALHMACEHLAKDREAIAERLGRLVRAGDALKKAEDEDDPWLHTDEGTAVQVEYMNALKAVEEMGRDMGVRDEN